MFFVMLKIICITIVNFVTVAEMLVAVTIVKMSVATMKFSVANVVKLSVVIKIPVATMKLSVINVEILSVTLKFLFVATVKVLFVIIVKVTFIDISTAIVKFFIAMPNRIYR